MTIEDAHIEITKAINKLLFRWTNTTIPKGEYEHIEKIIENTKDYRLSIIKVANERTLYALEKDLLLVADVALDMLKLIELEFDSRDMKKQFGEK